MRLGENSPMDRNSAGQYVQHLYDHLLRRNPGEEEKSHWIDTLINGMPEWEVFEKFIQSVEYQRRYRVRCAFPDGHFHSPVVDPSEISYYINNISRSDALLNSGTVPGISIDDGAMVEFWKRNAATIALIPFTETPSEDNRYHYHPIYPYGDAVILHAVIAAYRPDRIIEIGSGYSTACILDSLDHFGVADFELTCIEPDADRVKGLLRPTDFNRITLLEQSVQRCSLDIFEKLRPNDILFIDSTHVLKTGSDVHYELFSILPALRPGVLIHFHDIQYPFEYPDAWLNQNFSWNEIYALRAFLMYNSQFEIIFFNGMFAYRHMDLVSSTCPMFLNNPGGSIWLKKLSEPER
jgi:hypothetical protein